MNKRRKSNYQQIEHYTLSYNNNNTTQDQNTGVENTNLFNIYTYRNEINQNLTNIQGDIQSHINIESQIFQPWRPSAKLVRLFNQFQDVILHDYPHIPCCYCSMLMFKSTAQWTEYKSNEDYTLPLAFPEISVYLRNSNRGSIQVAICRSCKNPNTRRY